MRIRLVIDLEYPNLESDEDVARVKDVLSDRVVSMARDGAFNLIEPDPGINVGEVLVGCAVIEEPSE